MLEALVLLAVLTNPFVVEKEPPPAVTLQHGDFSVVETPDKQGTSCSLMINHAETGKVFHVSMAQKTGMLFISFYVTTLDQLRGAAVSLQIDHQELMRFDPPAPDAINIGVQVEATDERFQRALEEGAKNARLFEVVAGDFRWPVPIDGLKKAAGDYLDCRQDGRL